MCVIRCLVPRAIWEMIWSDKLKLGQELRIAELLYHFDITASQQCFDKDSTTVIFYAFALL